MIKEDNIFRIEGILHKKKRGRDKWKGYPEKFNSWVMVIFSAREMDQTRAFYLTIPSNSSMQLYPTNTLTNFTTEPPNSLFLDEDWEVGLAEIQYPYT